MREILFKAKRIDTGEWVQGGYLPPGRVRDKDTPPAIVSNGYMPVTHTTTRVTISVDPETVCQYIGKNDAERNKIFSGDIVTKDIYWDLYKKDIVYFEVVYHAHSSSFKLKDREGDLFYVENSKTIRDYIKLVGSIHDNPELLEVKK